MSKKHLPPPVSWSRGNSREGVQPKAGVPRHSPPAIVWGGGRAPPERVAQRIPAAASTGGHAPPPIHWGNGGPVQAKSGAVASGLQRCGPPPPAHGGSGPISHGRASGGGGVRLGALQAMLSNVERTAFFSETIKEVPVSKGQHRRHIIPSSLMVGMINSWKQYWSGARDECKKALTARGWASLQDLYEEMNNYQNNLIPGDGAVNTAIGMIMHNYKGALKKYRRSLDDYSGSAQDFILDMHKTMTNLTGFQLGVQENLLAPYLEEIYNDATATATKADMSAAIDKLNMLAGNASFDWPYGGAQNYDIWRDTHDLFIDIMNDPDEYDVDAFFAAVDNFLSLPPVY